MTPLPGSNDQAVTETVSPLPADAPWVVMKFGGTSVARAEGWRNIRALAASRRAQGARVLLVVSALAGVTDALEGLCAETDAEHPRERGRGHRRAPPRAGRTRWISRCPRT